MKNYPLLPLNHRKQWIAWNKTYLTEINHNIYSLWDFNNYFLPDYARKYLEIEEKDDSIEASELDYNEYFRAINDTTVKINGTPISSLFLKPGFLLVSKARNEGSSEEIYNADNYFVQPYGYASYYTFSYNNEGKIIATYDPYAEETYGLKYSFSLFDHFPRFVLINNDQRYTGKTWTIVSYTFDENQVGHPQICTKAGTAWTDINFLRPMFFHFIENNEYDYGEEIIIDTQNAYSVNVDKISIAQYTELVTEKGDNEPWPTEGLAVRVI